MRLVGLVLLLPSAAAGNEVALDPGDPAARLSAAPEATEYWDLVARFDGGYRLFVRFGITNEGPGEQSAAAIWYLVHPDGHVSELRNGRIRGNWKLSPDRLRLDIASSSLDLHGPVRRVAIDTTSQGAKIDLRFPVGETPVLPASPSAAKFHADTLQMSAPIEGTIWLRGMRAPITLRGTAMLTHAWMNESLPKIVQRRIEFVAGTPEVTIYLSDIMTPSGGHQRCLVLARDGVVAYQATDFDLDLGSVGSGTADGRYPLPGRLLIRAERISLTITPLRVLVRTDPLNAVPQPFRLLFALKIRPRWIWADASFHLEFRSGVDGAPPIEANGQGIVAASFVNPLSTPD